MQVLSHRQLLSRCMFASLLLRVLIGALADPAIDPLLALALAMSVPHRRGRATALPLLIYAINPVKMPQRSVRQLLCAVRAAGLGAPGSAAMSPYILTRVSRLPFPFTSASTQPAPRAYSASQRLRGKWRPGT